MRTVYDVHNREGVMVSSWFASCSSAEDERAWRAIRYLDDAPYTVVERQVAGPEDTDELLRLRALVDDLRLHVCPLPAVDYLLRSRGFDGPADGPFGGES